MVVLLATTAITARVSFADDVSSTPRPLTTELQSQGIESTTGEFHGFTQYNFKLDGVDCKIVSPKQAASGNPWVWRARFWGHEPQFDRAMLEQGWHVCYCDVGGLFGADPAIERWDAFYSLSQKLGLHAKPFLEGMSRGGLIIMRWASVHPDQVAGIYADNAVMDIRSWPGGKGTGIGSPRAWTECLAAYEMTDEQSASYKAGPLDRLKRLADAGVPIFVLINEADDVVPPAENGDRLVAEYKKLGGKIEVMRRPGLGHHPHSLKDPAPIVAFALTTVNDVRHSLLIAGPSFTGILDEQGQEVWNAGKAAARDGFVLPNGNVLIAWKDVVKEMTRDHEVVFQYRKSKENAEIGTVERLENGNTLITELGKKPRLIEVARDGTVVVDFPLQPETNNTHMQTRMARKLPSGNYLVPHLLAFKVEEYTAAGKVVHEIKTDLQSLGGREAENWPFTAIRLENGNTVVTLTHGNKVVEFDPKGEVVWEVNNDDLPGSPLVDPCGAQRLPNGNTVIASYGARQGIKVLEVNPAKQIVWSYSGKHRAHEIQVLTTNGQPITGPPMK
ncbi:putative secreted protein [Rhodopirellula maiorica SM1]|uniref:Putative secreted protein n=2 Tax=Novipirellula TaxID=2795426 RepID=M5RZP7_9BACT|nr:putative secreted protein [Rhodopirellula maiorica SM1]